MIAADSDPQDSRQPPRPLDRAGWARLCPSGLWGMIHLPALPGAPLFGGDPAQATRFALAAAEQLVDAGFDAIFLENFNDAPFRRARIDAVTIAAMARCAAALRTRHPELRLGINCLRNDAASALAIAVACEADAIRVNVHCGSAWSDQGLLQGAADRTLRRRRELGSSVRILADLRVKHATPAGPRELLDEARDLRERGLADAILLTGARTGSGASMPEFAGLRAALPEVPLIVASGVDIDDVAAWAAVADGAIVGSALMEGGRAGGAIDRDRAQAIHRRWQSARGQARTEGTACA